LRAVGKRDGKDCASTEVRTAGAPASIRLSVDRDTIDAQPADVAHVTAEIVDRDGVLVPTAENLVRFTIEGGRILATDNGNLRDLDSFQSNQRRAFSGMALAIARADTPGRLRVAASADGLRGAMVSVQVRSGTAIPALR
jgi:beta-galactosidase